MTFIVTTDTSDSCTLSSRGALWLVFRRLSIKQAPPWWTVQRCFSVRVSVLDKHGFIYENRGPLMYGNLICLPVLKGWTAWACVCQSVAKQQGSCTNGGPFGLDLSPNCRKTERSLLFEENVLLCNLIPAALWCPCVLFALGLRDDRARWWSVWNNSCWLLFLNFPCFVETFKAIPDWSLSRLLLKVGIRSFLVYWLTEWGNNSDGIWCHNPSGGFTWSLETLQSRFHHHHQQWRDENL